MPRRNFRLRCPLKPCQALIIKVAHALRHTITPNKLLRDLEVSQTVMR